MQNVLAALPMILIGLVIGFIAGIIVIILMETTLRKDLTVDALTSILGQFTFVVSLLFGSTWISSQMFSSTPKEDWIHLYIPSAAISFLLCLLYPTFKLIARVGREIGKEVK
jgi:hypothetical protein